MRNTILSISAFGLAAVAAGYTISVNPPAFLRHKAPVIEPIRSTYSFGTYLSSGNLYADQTGLSYSECATMLRQEASGAIRTGLSYVCAPEDGDGSTFSLVMRMLNEGNSTFSGETSFMFEGMTERDCESYRAESNANVVANNPSLAGMLLCIPEIGTSYSTSLSWRLVSEQGHRSQLGTRSDCEANLAILEAARLEGSGSGLKYRCVEVP